MLKDIPGYMIVVKDNPASEYYASYCLPEWRKHFNIEIFDAITPKTMKKVSGLTFTKYSLNYKYTSNNIKAEITDTEKACFCSHYALWLDCCFLGKPILILEHDAYLLHPEKLWYDDKYGIIFYDNAAMGSYIIQPWFAERLVKHLLESSISCGPYALIHSFKHKENIVSLVVDKTHKMFTAASDQVMSKKYGNTIEHYSNLHPEHWTKKYFHKFIEID